MMTDESQTQAWFKREMETYMAQPGATAEGFREHVLQLVRDNPELARLVMEDVFTMLMREMNH